MIVLRNKEFSIRKKIRKEERQYTLKRRLIRAIGRARVKTSKKLEELALKEAIAAQKRRMEFENLPKVHNRKAKHFLNKKAAENNIITVKSKIYPTLPDFSYSGVIGDTTEPNSIGSALIDSAFNRVKSKHRRAARKLDRIYNIAADKNNPRPIIHIAKGEGVEAQAHEIGHSIPSKKIRRKFKNPSERAKANRDYMLKHAHNSVDLEIGG